MWRKKRLILAAVLAVALLVGITTAVAVAQSNGNADQKKAQVQAKHDELLSKVGRIYQEKTGTALDIDQLKAAFAQAQRELKDEALDQFLQKLVDNGRLTQEQADQYKAWLDARPDAPLPLPGIGHRGGMMGPGKFGPPRLLPRR